jgi:hypothetical protein
VTTTATITPIQNESTPNNAMRVAHAEVYAPTAAKMACEKANCPDTPKTR